jgi:hypothetical protein
MPKSDEQIIQESVDLLTHYRQVGLQQIEIYKDMYPAPVPTSIVGGRHMAILNGVQMSIEDAMRRISAEEIIFLLNVLDGFWNYYLLNITHLESPARQGIDRTLLEICYQKLLPYTHFSKAKKKQSLLITQLCDIGMLLAAPSEQDSNLIPIYMDDYDYFVSQLATQADKTRFEELKNQGYPTHIFARAKHNVWPSFYKAFSEYSEFLVFPWAGETPERQLSVRESAVRNYQHQHDFVHGSYTSSIAAVDDITLKKHLFTSCAIATQTGYQVLHLFNENYLGNRKVILNELSNETVHVMPDIFDKFSRLQTQ